MDVGRHTSRGDRNYNEDRTDVADDIVSMDPKNLKEEAETLVVGVFDGHGGHGCAQYMSDKLLKMICRNEHFPRDVDAACRGAILEADRYFLNLARSRSDMSGSCCLVAVLRRGRVTLAWCGDCRALLMKRDGRCVQATHDHKPAASKERQRIEAAGGEVRQMTVKKQVRKGFLCGSVEEDVPTGPQRVFPPGLAVSRALGNLRAKSSGLNLVIASPDVVTIDIGDYDGLILGSDGLFDFCENSIIAKAAMEANSAEEGARAAVQCALQKCPKQFAMDNTTAVVVHFS
eukprot:g4799.t1